MKPNVLDRTIIVDVQDLAAGVDSVEQVWRVPVGGARITGANFIFRTATVGVDAGNALTLELRSDIGGDPIRSSGVLGANQAAGTVVTGIPGAGSPVLPAGSDLFLSLNQGATADIGRASVQFSYTPLVS